MTQDSERASRGVLTPPSEWFERWWYPIEFAAAVTAHKAQISTTDFMTHSEAKPLREAWIAAKYAMILSQDRSVVVQLERDRFPDFRMRVRGELQLFEIVEADHLNRRRSQEYRRAAERQSAGLHLKVEHCDPWIEERAAISAVMRSIATKASKFYDPRPHLLVYVNFPLEGEPPAEILNAVQCAEKHSASFSAIWLLWGCFIIQLWPRAFKIRDRGQIGRGSGDCGDSRDE